MVFLTAVAYASLALTPVVNFVPDYVMISGQPNGGKGEIRGTTSWALNGSNQAAQVTDQHVFEIIFYGITYSEVIDWQANPPTKDTLSISLLTPAGVNLGVLTGVTPTSGTVESVWYLVHPATSNGLVPVHIPPTSGFALAGRSFYVLKQSVTASYIWQNGQWVGTGGNTTHQRIDFTLDKLLCSDMGASIDTRKAHGQPNLEGQLPGDPNAPPREVNFSNWFWKGGLFVGNMPYSSGDQSGLSRIQLRTDGTEGGGEFLFATLSLYYLGHPTDIDETIDIGAFVPTSSDSNKEQAESNLTWITRWTSVVPTSGSGTNWYENPISKVSFASTTNPSQYANWALTPTSGSNPWSFKYVCLAVDDESHLNLSTYKAWRYFASSQYHSQDPATNKDWVPRIWVLTLDDDQPLKEVAK